MKKNNFENEITLSSEEFKFLLESHIADNPLLKMLNGVWNQDKAGQTFVIPFNMKKREANKIDDSSKKQ